MDGKIYASDYSSPTPSNLTQAMSDFQMAFTAAFQKTPTSSVPGAASMDGLVLNPGMYVKPCLIK